MWVFLYLLYFCILDYINFYFRNIDWSSISCDLLLMDFLFGILRETKFVLNLHKWYKNSLTILEKQCQLHETVIENVIKGILLMRNDLEGILCKDNCVINSLQISTELLDLLGIVIFFLVFCEKRSLCWIFINDIRTHWRCWKNRMSITWNCYEKYYQRNTSYEKRSWNNTL